VAGVEGVSTAASLASGSRGEFGKPEVVDEFDKKSND
jgi:hypothetical protein